MYYEAWLSRFKKFWIQGPLKTHTKNLIATDIYTRRFIIRFFEQNDFDS
jgi:hypothetical protein